MQQAAPPFTPPKRPLGFDAPLVDFELPTIGGRRYRASDDRGKIIVINFWSANCPISRMYDAYFSGFAQSYGHKGVAFVAVDPNAYEDEDDIHRAIDGRNVMFPILRDPNALLADYFRAEATPHVYVFDAGGLLRYRGAVDNRTDTDAPSTNYLEEVVDALLLDREITIRETPPYGCPIVRAAQV